MTHQMNRSRRRGMTRMIVGALLLTGLLLQTYRMLHESGRGVPGVVVQGPRLSSPSVAYAAPVEGQAPAARTLEQQAADDAIGFFEDALERYDRRVRDYSCVFTKQELVGGKLSEVQVIEALFREKPFSVLFTWLENEDKCSRALYVKDRWFDEHNQPTAVVVPGPLARLFVDHVMRPIHGPDAERSSRRTIDQFGMRQAIELTLKYCRMAREQGQLKFEYVGNGEVDGRETLVFERHLPYTGEGGVWPDRLLIVHVDRELMLPTRCECYADAERKTLLGTYTYTDVRINVNHPDSVFTKKGMGL